MLSLASQKAFWAGLIVDLNSFLPELILVAGIVAMLLGRLFTNRLHMKWVALASVLLAILVGVNQWGTMLLANPASHDVARGAASREMFHGLLVFDLFAIFGRLFLLASTALLIWLSMLTGIPDTEDSADFYCLLLGSVLGMCLMTAANNLLMAFLAIEMASVPSYALAGFLKGRKQSSEAALKYVVFGGAAAGVMVYGLSLLAGLYGTLHVPSMAQEILHQFSPGAGRAPTGFDPALALALLMTMVGFAFKLSAVPFHFWCPDVFEGAAAEVAAFLSVVSKGAAICLLARFTLALVGVFHSAPLSEKEWLPALQNIGAYLSPTLAVMAAVTATFGNLAAYSQTNLKRLLAYSTIAHAGYMLMALATLTVSGANAALFYLLMYAFMNIGAFAVVAFLRNQTGAEDLNACTGLIYRAPLLTICMVIFLLSLTGLPPLAGFIGKFLIFAALYEAKLYWLLLVAGINTVISLVYYVNVARIMIIQGEPNNERPWETFGSQLYAGVLAIIVVYFGIFWNTPGLWTTASAESLKNPVKAVRPVPGKTTAQATPTAQPQGILARSERE